MSIQAVVSFNSSSSEIGHLQYKEEAAHSKKISLWEKIAIYAGRIGEFNATDWLVFLMWVGMIIGLMASFFAFLCTGDSNGVYYPAYVWNILIGIFIFGVSTSFNTIGHKTIYYVEPQKAESLIVYHVTIMLGIVSSVLLCLAYHYPVFLTVPVLVLVGFFVMYSFIDECTHWIRHYTKHSGPVEMCAHVGIFTGFKIMMAAWVWWFLDGYPGVAETLPHF